MQVLCDLDSTTYVASFEPAADHGGCCATKLSLGHGGSARIVLLGDGAAWVWEMARVNFPQATCIVDFYHAAEHLAETVSKVIHKRRRKAVQKPSPQPAPIMNNLAADAAQVVTNLPPGHDSSGRKAPGPARSCLAHPARVLRISPTGSRAHVRRSENARAPAPPSKARSATPHSAGAQNHIPTRVTYQLDQRQAACATATNTTQDCKPLRTRCICGQT